jgi:anti-sigma B factor antagonist
MTVKQRKVDSFVILDLGERLTIQEDLDTIRNTVSQLVDSGVKDIAINLHHVTYLDSTGSATLIQCHQKVRSSGHRLKFLNPSHRVRKLFEITKLDTILDIDDETNIQSKA